MQKRKSLFLIGFLTVALLSCSEWDLERANFPVVTSGDPFDIGYISVSSEGQIDGLVKGIINEHGHIVSQTNVRPTLDDHDFITLLGVRGNGTFASHFSELKIATDYFIRAYAITEDKVIYGASKAFRTLDISIELNSIQVLPGMEVLITVDIGTPSISLSDDLILRLPLTISLRDLPDNSNYYFRLYLRLENERVIYSPVHLFHTYPPDTGWKRRRDFQGSPRQFYFSWVIDQTILVAGGTNSNHSEFYSDIWGYNIDSDNWSQFGAIPGQGRIFSNFAVAFSIDGIGYVGGGSQSSENGSLITTFDDYYEYSFPNQWSNHIEIESFVQSLPNDIGCSNSTEFNGKVYFFCSDKKAFVFNPKAKENHFRQLVDYPNGIVSNQSLISGSILVERDNLFFVWDRENNTFWKFEPLKGVLDPLNALPKGLWTSLGQITLPDSWRDVTFDRFFATGEKGYLGLGSISNIRNISEFWQFSPKEQEGQRWKRMPDFPGEYSGDQFLSIGNKLFIGIGRVGRPGIDFDPNTESGPLTNELWEFVAPEI